MDNFNVMLFLIIFVSFLSILVYFVVMFLYPELVGISGKEAKKIEDEQRGDQPIDSLAVNAVTNSNKNSSASSNTSSNSNSNSVANAKTISEVTSVTSDSTTSADATKTTQSH